MDVKTTGKIMNAWWNIPSLPKYLFRMMIMWAYRKYCRDFWHEEMWELCSRVSDNTRMKMYFDLSSRMSLSQLKDRLDKLNDPNTTYDTANLATIYEELIGK